MVYKKIRIKNSCYLVLLCLFLACGDQERETTILPNNLADYVTSNAGELVQDSLIACAFGGQIGFLENEQFPISILFYPEGNASDFNYFETETIEVNPDDLSNYQLQELADKPVFNGYLHRFERVAIDRNVWGRIAYTRNGDTHISNAIRIKYNDKPTEYNPALLAIDQSEKGAPSFSWEDGIIPENAIYFHALLDANNDLVSGTYTFDRQFQFYNLSNVVLNIRDITPAPSLVANENYNFLVMGVSVDNWVNLIVDTSFQAKE